MTRHLATACLLFLLVTAGCRSDEARSGPADDRITVVASFYPLYEAAREVGGDRVHVTNLTPAGAEPHDLELSPDQVERVAQADMVVVLGKGFQPSVEQVARQGRATTVEVLEHLDAVGAAPGGHTHGDEDNGGRDDELAVDPHVWLDPVTMGRIAEVIGEQLATLDRAGRAAYASAAARYGERLATLDRRYRTSLAACDRRVMVTAHAAFGWLAARYDLEQEAIAGIDPAAEPTPRRLAALVTVVRQRGVTTIFTETLVSPEVARTLAREAGVTTAVLDPLEGLGGAQLRAGADYVSVMEANLAVLRRALGCR